ncbi:O-antigen ligase family protein [Microbacterium sp. SLBN-111]|uniref:O-antigen ligase family protein n=1 Tax=Microbacterium sp. SLBN-111 TaxID=3377733 RepID=UPI003C70F35D
MIGPVVAFVACLLSLWVVLRGPAESTPARATSGILVISTVIPVGSVTDQAMAMIALSTIVLLSIIASVRHDEALPWPPSWGAVLFAAFGTWLVLRILGQFSFAATVLQVSIVASAMALAFVVPLLRADDLPIIADTFLWLTLAHTAYAVLEQTVDMEAVWPLRSSALEDIGERVNILIPALAGRSQSSFGHPIPFALFSSIALLVLLHAAAQTRRWRYAGGVVVAATALALSGTRSAVVAALAALAAYVVASIRWRRLLWILVGAGVVAIAALVTDLPTLLALDGNFESSVSYIHRSLVIGSWDTLWARDLATRLFGSGAGAGADLFREGVVRGAHTLLYFDNVYVSLFALSGLVALILFCAVLLRSVLGGALAVGGATLVAVMGFSFDEQQWQLALVLMAFCTMLPRAFGTVSRRPETAAADDGSPQRTSGRLSTSTAEM